MLNQIGYKSAKTLVILLLCLNLCACIGTVVGAVVDTTIEVVKIPFKVGAAVVDVVSDDDFTDVASKTSRDKNELDSDAAAIEMENAELR